MKLHDHEIKKEMDTMKELKKALYLRGMWQAELADTLGVSRQQVTEYISGRRALGPKMLPKVAEALGVTQAYLRGISECIPVYDYEAEECVSCPIMVAEELPGYGEFYMVDHPEIGPLAVILSAGIQFTPRDWQGVQPKSVEEIAETDWVDQRGVDAIMLAGLPRVFAGI